MLASSVAHFEAFGFVVLPRMLDPAPLAAEVDTCMQDAFADAKHMNAGALGNEFRYVPMMCEQTPISVALVMQFAAVAAELLRAEVLPGRAKGTLYRGDTHWHRDTDLAVRSIGFALYLEPLAHEHGALRVLPGSHRPEFAAAIAAYGEQTKDLPGFALHTLPGDVVVFDEHLYHASFGGGLRRQWRVDFVADDAACSDALRHYFAGQYSVGWDGGYDVSRFPSYGDHWRTLDPAWNLRLDELGAYRCAAEEEDFVRAKMRR